MSLRLAHVRRKDYQTEERELNSGIAYLVWTKYPRDRKLKPDNSAGVRAVSYTHLTLPTTSRV